MIQTLKTSRSLQAVGVIAILIGAAACDKDEVGESVATESVVQESPNLEELASAGALTFGDGGLLFLADSYGAKVLAIETGDTTPPANPVGTAYVESLDEEIAALAGADPQDVVINDLAVNPLSQNIYLSVHIGRSQEPRVLLVRRLADTGALELVELEGLTVTTAELPGPPGFEDTLQYGQSLRTLAITDLTFYADKLYVAGVSNEDFDSTLRVLPYPFTGAMEVSTLEIYHASHDGLETHAPIVTSLVHEIEGVPYLIAAYACTPLVRIPLDALVDGAHVIGETIAELGYGNAPVDILAYQAPAAMGGGSHILITNTQRAAVSVSVGAVESAEPLTTVASGPTGLDQRALPLTGALHTELLNSRYTVVVKRNVQTGKLSLMSLFTGLFFEVSENTVEYNFPNVADSTTPSTNPVDYGFEAE